MESTTMSLKLKSKLPKVNFSQTILTMTKKGEKENLPHTINISTVNKKKTFLHTFTQQDKYGNQANTKENEKLSIVHKHHKSNTHQNIITEKGS